jgi:hypothetical protein
MRQSMITARQIFSSLRENGALDHRETYHNAYPDAGEMQANAA